MAQNIHSYSLMLASMDMQCIVHTFNYFYAFSIYGCHCPREFLPFLRYNDNVVYLCLTFQALIFHVFNLLAEKRSKPLSRVCQRCWGHILSRILPTIMCYNPQICLWGHFNGIHIQNIQVGRILEQFIFYS